MKSFDSLREKTLTPAEKKKREEIAKAIEKDDPEMPMDKKMAIATATAKRVAEYGGPKISKSEYLKKGKEYHAKKECKDEVDFKPHMMYNPKTGEGVKANTYADHVKLDKKGYTHEKPEVKEGAENYTVKKGPYTRKVDGKTADKMKRQGWKIVAREGLEEATVFVKEDTQLKTFEQIREARGKNDYPLYHKTYSGAMAAAYELAKKKGYTVDTDDIDRKVAMGPKKPSSGKTNSFTLKLDGEKKKMLAVQVTNLDNKRYELNTYIT